MHIEKKNVYIFFFFKKQYLHLVPRLLRLNFWSTQRQCLWCVAKGHEGVERGAGERRGVVADSTEWRSGASLLLLRLEAWLQRTGYVMLFSQVSSFLPAPGKTVRLAPNVRVKISSVRSSTQRYIRAHFWPAIGEKFKSHWLEVARGSHSTRLWIGAVSSGAIQNAAALSSCPIGARNFQTNFRCTTK